MVGELDLLGFERATLPIGTVSITGRQTCCEVR